MKKPVLCLDAHGCICDFASYVLNVVNERHGTEFTEAHLDSYYFKDCKNGLGEYAGDAEDVCNELMEEGSVYGKLDPYPEAPGCVWELSWKYDLWVVTHVTPKGIVPVIKWFYDHQLPVKCVFPVNDPTEKLAIVQGTVGIVEDRAKTVRDMTAQGVKAWMVNRPPNANEDVPCFRGTLDQVADELLR